MFFVYGVILCGVYGFQNYLGLVNARGFEWLCVCCGERFSKFCEYLEMK